MVGAGRGAHESTLGAHEGHPGTRHLYGEVRCDQLEELQRRALDSPRPQLVVKVDRSGLNEHHPVVTALYEAIDRVLRPIVAAEERRAGAHLIRPGQALKARDQVGLRALNDALKGASTRPDERRSRPATNRQAGQRSPSVTRLRVTFPPSVRNSLRVTRSRVRMPGRLCRCASSRRSSGCTPASAGESAC